MTDIPGGKQRLALSAAEDVSASRGSGAGVFVAPRKAPPSSSLAPVIQVSDSANDGAMAPGMQISRAMSPVVRHASPMARRENRRAAVMVDMPTNFNFEDLAAEFAKEDSSTSGGLKSSATPGTIHLASSVSEPLPVSPPSPHSRGRMSPQLMPTTPLPAVPPQKPKPDLQAKMQSATNSVAEGIALIKQAVEHDSEGRLPSALPKYQLAVAAFKRALQEETDPAVLQSLHTKVAEYSKRVAAIQASLDSQPASSAAAALPRATSNGGAPAQPALAPRDRKFSVAEGAPPVVAQRAVGGRERKLSAANATEANIADNDRFRALFNLSEAEQLLADCAIALELAGTTHTGRMFLSAGWLCFSSYNHTEKVRWPEVADMQRKRGMMGSRLDVTLKARDQALVFKTLLLQSDQIFDVCIRIWNNSTPPPEVFGVPLRELVLREAAKKVTNKQIPFVISYSAEYIKQHGLSKDGIFRVSVGNDALERLAIAVKYNDPISFDREDGPYEAAALIKKFLRDLPTPLSSPSLYSMYITIARLPRTADFLPSLLTKLRQVLKEENEVDRAVLAYIVRLLATVAANHAANRMDAKNLSLLFGPIVFRPPAGSSLNASLTDIPAVCSLVYLFITEYSRVFDAL